MFCGDREVLSNNYLLFLIVVQLNGYTIFLSYVCDFQLNGYTTETLYACLGFSNSLVCLLFLENDTSCGRFLFYFGPRLST